MKKFIKRIALITCMFSLCTNIVVFSESDITIDESALLYRETVENIMKNYKGENEINERILFDAAMKGMFNSLDRYSEYFTIEEYKDYSQSVQGIFYGIGAVISNENTKNELIQIYEDSPAMKAGIQVGDIIKTINNQDVYNLTLDEISNLIKGEKGTFVNITIERGNERIDFTVCRDEIKENPVHVKMINELSEDDKTGGIYVKIDSFNLNMMTNLRKELDNYYAQGINNVIIDLRNNPGGDFIEALEFAAYFLEKNSVITTMVDANNSQIEYKTKRNGKDFNVVILVNKNSASASELTSAALKENGKAIVVGENTYGKSVAQSIYSDKKVNYKLTTEEYLTPLGNSIKEGGLTPNYIVEVPNYIYKIENKYYLNDTSSEMVNIKKILKYLGYNVGEINEKYDEITFNAVVDFQGDTGLGVYGGIDFTTQNKMNEVLKNSSLNEDRQFNKAVEVLNNYENYIIDNTKK